MLFCNCMLYEFIRDNRVEILHRARLRVASRSAPHPTSEELEDGLPLFLDELVNMLRDRLHDSGVIDLAATRHGQRRFDSGFTIAQVVHDYGDVCQVVTELAIESDADVDTQDFRVLNRCLDDAIAGAVTEHTRASRSAQAAHETERLGVFAHELRNQLNTACVAYQILKEGTISIGGSTGAVLGRSLTTLRHLVDRSLAEVRLDAGLHQSYPIDVATFIAHMEFEGVISANAAGVSLSTDLGESGVEIDGDRQLLGSAVTNLLQNAFKFSHTGGHVSLRASSAAGRVKIEIEDECGGLPDAVSTKLFKAFHQEGEDRTGLGLGLLISARAVKSMRGNLSARDVPGKGCVFTIDLPRRVMQSA